MNAATHVISVFVGIDVSKSKLDCAVRLNGKIKFKVVSNDRSGFTPRSSVKGHTMIFRTDHAAQSLVHAGTGGITPQPNPASVWHTDENERAGPKAVVGAAMRKLAHLIYGVVKSGKPFDANFATNGLAIQDGI